MKIGERLNREYLKLHKNYENLFWRFYMGEKELEKEFNEANKKLQAFQSNRELAKEAKKAKLKWWVKYFELQQTPENLVALKSQIIDLESEIHKKRTFSKQGYIDPKTGKFMEMSENQMGTMMGTNDDESVRKACFEAIEKSAVAVVDDYVKLIGLRNKYAKEMGYDDFYDYKLRMVEGMTKEEVFGIFEEIYEKTKYAFKDIRKMEKTMPGLRKPWNFRYLTSGDFIKEEDKYFKFEKALMYWGESFAALGIDFNGGELTLDLLDRKGKYNNGFCHYQDVTHWKNDKMVPGSADFTCNAVPGQVGSGLNGLITLFHEGAHAADRLNSIQKEAILNTEYPPASVAWAETHSQFCDTISSSIEWKARYASYPFELYERKLRKLHKFSPLGMMGIIFVSDFEKEIYETKKLTVKKVLKTAQKMHRKYYDESVDSCWALHVPHIYSWESSAYYHGYGLSELAVFQWREYFYDKYGYIVDNPKVGKEMKKVWQMGSTKTFLEFVKLATGKKLSTEAYIKNVTRPLEVTLELAEKKIKKLVGIPRFKGEIELNAKINMVHGKEKIADNSKGFEEMAEKYSRWLKTMEK